MPGFDDFSGEVFTRVPRRYLTASSDLVQDRLFQKILNPGLEHSGIQVETLVTAVPRHQRVAHKHVQVAPLQDPAKASYNFYHRVCSRTSYRTRVFVKKRFFYSSDFAISSKLNHCIKRGHTRQRLLEADC